VSIPPNQLIQISAKKRAASSLLYLLAAAWRARNALRPARPERVLVLEPVGLGDMVGFVPLVRELLARRREVLVCSKPEWRPLYPDRPGQTWIDLRLPWASHNESVKYNAKLYLQEPTSGDLKRMRAAAAGATGLDTRGDIRSVLLLYWAGCRRVVSLSNYLGSNLPMWPMAAEIVPFDNTIRRWELNARFLKAVDPAADLGKIERPRLEHFIDRRPERRAILMPIAPWAGKLWPKERWQAVAAELRRRGWEVAGLCGPKQSAKAAEQIGAGVPMTECGSLAEWAREFNRAAFVITLDSGPMHLADALDAPVIALFGVGKLPLWAPSGPRSVVLSHQDAPDFHVYHPLDVNVPIGQKFMNRIGVEEVLGAVDQVSAAI
jgi:hypothetical protein